MSDLRERLTRRVSFSTHWEGCESAHIECAVIRFLDKNASNLDRLRKIEAAAREVQYVASECAVTASFPELVDSLSELDEALAAPEKEKG